MAWHNPLTWFSKDIELYCQNPQCKSSLISEDEGTIANLEGDLVHSGRECVIRYMLNSTYQSGVRSIVVSRIPYVSYRKAQKLARKGKVNFSKLETIAKEAGK